MKRRRRDEWNEDSQIYEGVVLMNPFARSVELLKISGSGYAWFFAEISDEQRSIFDLEILDSMERGA